MGPWETGKSSLGPVCKVLPRVTFPKLCVALFAARWPITVAPFGRGRGGDPYRLAPQVPLRVSSSSRALGPLGAVSWCSTHPVCTSACTNACSTV